MKVVENLIALFELGFEVGQLRSLIVNRNRLLTPYDVAFVAGLLKATLEKVSKDEVLPFGQAKDSAAQLKNVMDQIWTPAKAMVPFNDLDAEMFSAATDNLGHNLRHELNELPIFVVTKRTGYDVDTLLGEAEKVFAASHIPLLSDKTRDDIREAGICLAFNVPTACGFHSVRAVEAVARAYEEVITGTRPGAETPLGPLVNKLRNERDNLEKAGKISKDDSLHLAIDFLQRINGIYRKPITHPEMTLELETALTVFDGAKCAITLMIEDSLNKRKTPPIPNGFF